MPVEPIYSEPIGAEPLGSEPALPASVTSPVIFPYKWGWFEGFYAESFWGWVQLSLSNVISGIPRAVKSIYDWQVIKDEKIIHSVKTSYSPKAVYYSYQNSIIQDLRFSKITSSGSTQRTARGMIMPKIHMEFSNGKIQKREDIKKIIKSP